MIDIDPIIAEAVEGSFSPAVDLSFWRDGEPTYEERLQRYEPPLVLSWETTEDATRMSRGAKVVIATQDPGLVPRSLDAVLEPRTGSEFWLQSGVDLGPDLGRRFVSEGFFRIDSAVPRDWWERYPEVNRWAFSGAIIELTGTDRTKALQQGRFESRVTASSGSTVYAAIDALCDGYVPVGEHRVADRSIARVTFDGDDRIAAIDQIAKSADARAVFDRDGDLVLVPRTSSSSTWAVRRADVIDVSRDVSDAEFYNAVIARGRNDSTQAEYQARVVEQSGPAAYRDGLRVPYFFESPLLTTQAATQAAAQTTFDNIVKRRQAVATLDVPYNPAIEGNDWVEWSEGPNDYRGQVRTVTRSSGGPTMRVGVWLSLADSWRLEDGV